MRLGMQASIRRFGRRKMLDVIPPFRFRERLNTKSTSNAFVSARNPNKLTKTFMAHPVLKPTVESARDE
jgi:hypothetical protein